MNTLVFEGAAWAACYNEYLFEKKLPNNRRVIVTGALIPKEVFWRRMDPYSKQNSLYLLVGNLHQSHELVLPDIWTMQKKSKGQTGPQFGYMCNENADQCLGFGTNLFVTLFQ